MPGNRYAAALATVLRASALPYGYTVTVWTSGMMLTTHRGTPTVGELFLFMAGAVSAFLVLGTLVRLTGGVPFDPPEGAMRRTGMIHFLAIGAALGAVALVALIQSAVAWPLGAFVATATYLAGATVELTLV
jgi:hypothetical protein